MQNPIKTDDRKSLVLKEARSTRIVNSIMMFLLIAPIPYLIHTGLVLEPTVIYLIVFIVAGPIIIKGFFRVFRIVILSHSGMQARGLVKSSSHIKWNEIENIEQKRQWIKVYSIQGKKIVYNTSTDREGILEVLIDEIINKRVSPDEAYEYFIRSAQENMDEYSRNIEHLKSLEVPVSNNAIIPDIISFSFASLIAGLITTILYFEGLYYYVITPIFLGFIIAIFGRKMAVRRKMISPPLFRIIFIPVIAVVLCFDITSFSFYLYDYIILPEDHLLAIAAHNGFVEHLKELINAGFDIELFDRNKPAGQRYDTFNVRGNFFLLMYGVDMFFLYITTLF